jgi:hypothetical protein
MNTSARNLDEKLARIFGKRSYKYRLDVPRDRTQPFPESFF